MIFDLWDTLVDYPAERSQELERVWADRLGVAPEDFHQRWRAERPKRDVGALADSLRAVGTPDELVGEFVAMRLAFTRELLVPRPGALETLRELRGRGLGLGLITVCSEEVGLLWEETAFAGLFDATVFSAACGLRKPDPEIYLLACRQLGVEPSECLFVGDGANDELAGAERLGMRAALIHRAGAEPLWEEARRFEGPRITSIPEVLALLGSAER